MVNVSIYKDSHNCVFSAWLEGDQREFFFRITEKNGDWEQVKINIDDLSKAEKERDQLAARVAELESAITEFCDEDAGYRAVMFQSDLEKLLNRQPPASLEAHDKRVRVECLQNAGKQWDQQNPEDEFNQGVDMVSKWLIGEAQRIEEEG